jgi:hypothetical protein
MAKTGFALLGSAAFVAGSCLLCSVAHAQGDSAAWRANTGLVTGLGLALLVPEEGSLGGGLELTARYGIPAGPVIIAPGGLLGGYYLQERFIGMLMPTLRATLPLGPLAPFVQGGLGPGGITNPGEGGLAWLGGGGLMIHFGDFFALGAEINYQGITGTGYKALSIGPSIIIGG